MWRELTLGELAYVLPHTRLTAADGQAYSVVSSECRINAGVSLLILKHVESGERRRFEVLYFDSHLLSGLRIFDAPKQVCECGSLKCGGTAHSTWCPLYAR